MLFFFFNDTATTEIYTLSLHDALPIFQVRDPPVARPRAHEQRVRAVAHPGGVPREVERPTRVAVDEPPVDKELDDPRGDRKSTRLNSSHANISYAVFCLKKKNTIYSMT